MEEQPFSDGHIFKDTENEVKTTKREISELEEKLEDFPMNRILRNVAWNAEELTT